MATRSHSNLAEVSFFEKARQSLVFLGWRLNSRFEAEEFDALIDELQKSSSLYEQLSGKPFVSARVFEIGYGARPLRLFAWNSMGIDVRGIDLDVPMVRWSFARLWTLLRTNGPVRAGKTAVRNLLFDRREQNALAANLKARGYNFRIDPSRLLVGDAALFDFRRDKYDFIYSFDVFEHIPRADLETLTANLAHALAPGGLALIAPQIFTGISGGHLPEWFAHLANQDVPRNSRPWEHLRDSPRIADVYLNQLTRADYRDLFSIHFEIVEEIDRMPNLGRQWLTPEIRRELVAWTDEDLFSNNVWFLLRPRRAGTKDS